MEKKNKIDNGKFLIAAVLIITPILVAIANGYWRCSSFWYAYMGYVGTTFLGFAVFFQNELHNRSSKDQDAANTSTPFFVIESVVGSSRDENGVANFDTSHYKCRGRTAMVSIKNIGQGIAVNLTHPRVFGKYHNPDDHKPNQAININKSYPIKINLTEKATDKIFKIDIEYQNMIGYKYRQTLTYKLVSEVKEEQEEYYLYVYLLGKQQRIGISEEEIHE